MRSLFCSSGISPTSESDYPSTPFSTSILLTKKTLNNDQSKPRTQLTATMAITVVKLSGASHPAGTSVRFCSKASIQQVLGNINIF